MAIAYRLGSARTVIGRARGVDIAVPGDPEVSRRHAEIRLRSDGAVLRDLRSKNGTYINGSRAVEQRLNDGDRIRVGHAELVWQGGSLILPEGVVAVPHGMLANRQALMGTSRQMSLPLIVLLAGGGLLVIATLVVVRGSSGSGAPGGGPPGLVDGRVHLGGLSWAQVGAKLAGTAAPSVTPTATPSARAPSPTRTLRTSATGGVSTATLTQTATASPTEAQPSPKPRHKKSPPATATAPSAVPAGDDVAATDTPQVFVINTLAPATDTPGTAAP